MKAFYKYINLLLILVNCNLNTGPVENQSQQIIQNESSDLTDSGPLKPPKSENRNSQKHQISNGKEENNKLKDKKHITSSEILKNLNIQNLKIDNKIISNTSLVDYSLFSNFTKEQKKELVLNKCKDNKINKCVGVMLGMALGDSIGAPLEFRSIEELGPNQKSKFDYKNTKNQYHNKSNKFKVKRGQWTDDASMGLCMADSLIINKGFNGSDIRIRFWNWWNKGYNNAFRNDKSRTLGRSSIGLGGNISKSLNLIPNQNPSEKFHPAYNEPPYYRDDSGNGSLMRLAPIPMHYCKDINEAVEMSKKSSYTTHPGHTAAEACGLLGFIIVKAINNTKKLDIKTFIDHTLKEYLEILEKEMREVYDGGDVSLFNKSWGVVNVIKLIKSDQKEDSKEYCWNWRTDIETYKKSILKSYKTRKDDGDYNGYPVSDTYWGSFCIDGLAMALNAVYNSNNLLSAIQNAVNFLGDADSTGSIAGQIAGTFYGFNETYLNPNQKQFIENVSKWDDWEIGLRGVLL
ncbi:MAG: hypothetical protein GY830_04640 [Bacteroidetes bacterium]|nr:hypothetical protein [Bacteroidota bacterium]